MNINLIIYLLEVSVLTSIFYLFYRYLYFKLAYFTWSRYYLNFIILLSLLIPVLPGVFNYELLNTNIVQIYNNSNLGNINGLINSNNHFANDNNSVFNPAFFVKLFLIIWISGIVRYVFVLLKHVFSLRKLIKYGIKFKENNIIYVKTDFPGSIFSFLNFIFTNKQFDQLSEKEQAQIINHEKIHVRQFHSIDNLIFELFRAVFWFNPVSKLIAADIKIIHEFIVDNVLTQNKNKTDYSKLILKLSSQSGNLMTVSHFSKEEIKNRIQIISYPEKEKIRKRRFKISIPVLILTIFASWFIMSSTNNYFKIQTDEKKVFHKPFDKKSYKIISPYFENKKINTVTVSHKETSYELKSFSNIYAIDDGIISNIKTKDIFGLKEITIFENLNAGFNTEYSGLCQSFVQPGDSVKRGSVIGKSGDIGLYPTVNIKLLKNEKTYNPENFY